MQWSGAGRQTTGCSVEASSRGKRKQYASADSSSSRRAARDQDRSSYSYGGCLHGIGSDSKKLASPKATFGGGFTSSATEFRTTPGETNGLSQHELAQLVQAKLKDRRTQNGIALDSLDLDGPVGQLCRVLETGVQRPVLDRTGYQGNLRISIRRNGVGRDQFFERIKADYGLAVTPAKAEVQHLMVSAEAPKHSY